MESVRIVEGEIPQVGGTVTVPYRTGRYRTYLLNILRYIAISNFTYDYRILKMP